LKWFPTMTTLTSASPSIPHPESLRARTARKNLADELYRPYFIAGILISLTLGAGWGARLLWKITTEGAVTAAGVYEINAHGDAQIFGWVGLFIMGFGYQMFPPMWQTRLPQPGLAILAMLAMIAGIGIRTLAMTLHDSWSLALPAAALGGGLQFLAVATFIMQMLTTLEQRHVPFDASMAFITAALGWFGLSTALSVGYALLLMAAPSREDLVFIVGTYQTALRHVQIYGTALIMILGVSLKILPAMFEWPRIPTRRALMALVMLVIAVAGGTSFLVAYRWTQAPALAAAVYASWMLLAAGVAMVVMPWAPWRPLPRVDRCGKFVRAAYLWLGVSLIMLLLMPLYHLVTGMAFSHAYFGAVRHAITVGFISMMIVGVASKIVPALRGWSPPPGAGGDLSALWGPFILLNAGCTLRVVLQPLTDLHPAFFKVLGISGTLEFAALAWWGAGMIFLMLRPRRSLSEIVALNIDVKNSETNRGACCPMCAAAE